MTPIRCRLPVLLSAALLLIGASQGVMAAVEAPPPRISVLTFGPGEIYWQRFGHNALLVRDHGQAVVYNYGYFDWSQDNFLLNFARGRMVYFLAADSVNRTLAQYNHEGREVIEQELDLAPEQARWLADFLEWNAHPDNAPYRYDYYLAACSTKIRDALDEATGGALQFMHEQPGTLNYRQQTIRLTAPDVPLMLALDFLLGPAADRPRTLWEESFVPEVLAEGLRQARRVDSSGREVPLVRQERLLLPASAERAADAPPEVPPALVPAFLAAALVWATLLLAARRWWLSVWGVIASVQLVAAGVGGLVLAFMTAATGHWAGFYNLNAFGWNPLAFFALAAVWAIARGRVPSGLGRAVLLLLPGFALLGLAGVLWQDNLHHTLFWLLAHTALAWTALRRPVRATA